MPVNSTHPEYDANEIAWLRARDVLAGEDAVKAAGVRYLPRLESQSDDEYAAYKALAAFFNASSRTADGFLGLIFRRPPFVKLPEGTNALGRAMSEVADDTDLLGTPLVGYAKKIVAEVIAVGRAGTLIDCEEAGVVIGTHGVGLDSTCPRSAPWSRGMPRPMKASRAHPDDIKKLTRLVPVGNLFALQDWIKAGERLRAPDGNYVVMKLWRDSFAPNLLAVDGPDRPLNFVATGSADKKTVFLKAVNPGTNAVEATLRLNGDFKPRTEKMQLIVPGGETMSNSLEQPDNIKAVSATAKVADRTVKFTMPPLSAGVVRVSR